MHTGSQGSEPARPDRVGLAFTGFLIAAAFFFVTEHRAHLYGAWPFLLILLCPLMHLFMHRGHGRESGSDRSGHQGGAGGPHTHGGAR